MINESKYPTMRLMLCRKCGNVFAAGFSGDKECPDCSSQSTTEYNPEEISGEELSNQG
ncbi:MAG: hypothetical protein GX089_15515 [Fibrobacter sp.]|jgi:predicted  nucleic acid-binding Zn-ribbon protein|nr:hypothetical protein [Fibrobacter sp.]